jgi:hypothetical protein
MKRCLSLSFWLAAWGVWLWLGFGLHRELPRKLPSPHAELPIAKRDAILGFVRNSPLLAVKSPDPRELRIRVFDASSGTVVHDSTRNPFKVFHPQSANAAANGAFLLPDQRLTEAAPGEPRRVEHSFDILDLTAGEWRRVSNRPVHGTAVHPTKTWVAFCEFGSIRNSARPLVVVDWSTNAELFVRAPTTEQQVIGAPIFVGDTDRLVIPTWRSPPDRSVDKPTDLEVWTIFPEPRLEKVVTVPWFGGAPVATSSGRLIWTRPGSKGEFDVFDLNEERMLLSIPPPEEREQSKVRNYRNPARISRGGRGAMGGWRETLWNLDSGKAIWKSNAIESFTPGTADQRFDDAFDVLEYWRLPWPFPTRFQWMTFAKRSLDDGSLVWRCWDVDHANLQFRSADGRFAVNATGAVYRLPLSADWPLLALCQSILALPLILLWAIFRWRSRRAARRQPAEFATPGTQS